MKIHHFGYAVKNIETSMKEFKLLGYEKLGGIYFDENRLVNIQFIKNNQACLELIEPRDENSPIKNILKKCGEGPYHICYETQNFDEDYSKLKENGYILVEKRNEAIALDGNIVAFFYKNGVGLIEILEKNAHNTETD